MRHRVRRQWRQWQDIGASDQVLRWIQEGVRIPFKHNRPPPNFHNGINMQDATPAQLTFLEGELARFVEFGAWELGTCRKWVSRLFLVPKPGVNQWRCIIDLRVLNSYCVRKRLKMETLLGVRHLTKKDDYMFSFDLQDGFYALGIAEADRDYFTVDVRAEPHKGLLGARQFGRHLGVDIDSASGMFYASADKLNRLSRQATQLIGRATRNARWLPKRELQSLAGQAQYLFLAIPAARFFLRELHSVVGDRWGGRFRMTPHLRRDLQWWTSVPSQSNSKLIHRPVETIYPHTDSSGYGWAGVLNGRLEARGFWSSADGRQHITWKELKAVRLAVESFLPHLAGRNVLMHEDNQAVSNIWADRLSRHLDSDDWQLDPLMFAELESRFCPHSIDRFASALITLLPRYNAAWLDPTCEAVDSLHLPDADWRRENNWCNAPWPLLPDLVQKLQQSGAAATVVAPRWEGTAWHQALTDMTVEELTVAPRAGFFRPGRRDRRASSLQPDLSAVNNFFKDHGREPMALGDLVSRVRKGLAASQGATTTAYVIGLTMQKIKYFGGWAMESSVVLDYIDPTVLPCPAAWHLFGWMTPWNGQPARLPRQMAT
eukprot:jgi/Tetstr1/421995/TSEL_001239.t1